MMTVISITELKENLYKGVGEVVVCSNQDFIENESDIEEIIYKEHMLPVDFERKLVDVCLNYKTVEDGMASCWEIII